MAGTLITFCMLCLFVCRLFMNVCTIHTYDVSGLSVTLHGRRKLENRLDCEIRLNLMVGSPFPMILGWARLRSGFT